MDQTCKNCKKQFEITEKDQQFYTKLAVPLPSLCHLCREQRRLSLRNERSLYRRTCDLCQRPVISVYSPDSPYKQICNECFWGSKENSWNAMEYGQDFNFNRPFFEQFNELRLKVPRINNGSLHNENCEYTNFTADSKNCYLVIATENSEDCYYCKLCQNNKNCVDCDYIWDSELCYDSINITKCFGCIGSVKLDNCSDCDFSFNLRGCKNCLFSHNLVSQEYCIYNKKVSKEVFEQERKKYISGSLNSYNEASQILEDIILHKGIHKANNLISCDNSTGDNLKTSRNMDTCFDMQDSEDCAYCSEGDGKFCYDCNNLYYAPELCLEILSTLHIYECKFCAFIYDSSYLSYCDYCHNSAYLFGCIGLHRKKYCILNKQYSKEEYETLVPKIIEHMKSTGEWGEFFPISISPFAYNETLANEFYPLSHEQSIAQGLRWKEKDNSEYQKQEFSTPENISTIDETIISKLFACKNCGRNFKLTKSEFEFYKKFHLPVPHQCPLCRYRNRMRFKNNHEMWDRSCTKCNKIIKSTYSPDRLEKVYCEECYLKEIH